MALFQALPPQFDKQTYIALLRNCKSPKIAIKRAQCQTCLSIAEREQFGQSQSTANKWLMKFVSSNSVTKQAHGTYSKNTV
jgi:hypothetical protein